ncbi:E3 ubiquitin ligase [Cryptosporidium felis]|nr:E3 ubiquitin ligase [Cryptosporidium felis]
MRLATLCYLPIHSGSFIGESKDQSDSPISISSFYKAETWEEPRNDDLIEVYVPPFVCNHYVKVDPNSEERECRMCFDYHKSHILTIRFKDLVSTNSPSEIEDLMRKYKVPICLKSIIGHYIRILKSYGDKWLRRKWVDVRYTALLSFPGFSTNNLVNICQVNTTLIPDSIEILEFCHLSIFEGNSKVKLTNTNEQYRLITSMRSIVELLTLMLQDRIFPKVIVQALNFTNSYGLISRIIWDILYFINDHKEKPLPSFVKKPPDCLKNYKYSENDVSRSLLNFTADLFQYNIFEFVDPKILSCSKYPLPERVTERLKEVQIKYETTEESHGSSESTGEGGGNSVLKGSPNTNSQSSDLHKRYGSQGRDHLNWGVLPETGSRV